MMAKIANVVNQKGWEEWVSGRPPVVQDLCRKLPPDLLYRMKSTGHRVTVYSYGEDGTVTVLVTGDYNLVTFDREVFGIKPEDLEECDLPPEGEPLGTVLTEPEEVDAFVEKARPAVLAARKSSP
jgi:hypothetical protein